MFRLEHPSIIYLSIYLSVFINHSIHLFIYLSSFYLSIFINRSINLSINSCTVSIHRSIIYLSIYLPTCTCPSKYLYYISIYILYTLAFWWIFMDFFFVSHPRINILFCLVHLFNLCQSHLSFFSPVSSIHQLNRSRAYNSKQYRLP